MDYFFFDKNMYIVLHIEHRNTCKILVRLEKKEKNPLFATMYIFCLVLCYWLLEEEKTKENEPSLCIRKKKNETSLCT